MTTDPNAQVSAILNTGPRAVKSAKRKDRWSVITPIQMNMSTAIAPFFGHCEDCRRELGWPTPELVGKPVNSNASFGWRCASCLAEFVRQSEIAQDDSTADNGQTNTQRIGAQ